MAERRMFSKSVIGSARFLRMPPSSRLLYYDLGMAADDDGVVEAFSVMRMTGAVEDDLKVLVSKGFITVLNEDLVAYIEDWSKNNQIRKDRYQPSIYQNLLVQIGAVNQLETVGQPDGNQRLTQDTGVALVFPDGEGAWVAQYKNPPQTAVLRTQELAALHIRRNTPQQTPIIIIDV